METELVNVAAKAILKKTQFNKIEANVSASGPLKTGELTVTTEVSLKGNKAGTPDALSSVTVGVVGIPKDSKLGDAPVFAIKVTIHGVYAWDAGLDISAFQDKNLASLLAKPLYVLAVSEVHSIAHKLGIQGVQLSWTVPAPLAAHLQKKLPTSKKVDITNATPKAKRSLKRIKSL